MLAFNNDYSHGAHPAVLQALVDTNMEPQPGYSTDAHTERAKQLIREACQAPMPTCFSGGRHAGQRDGDRHVACAVRGRRCC